MRITQSMITKSLLSSINQNRESMYSIQESITTGKEVERSSDDPVQFFRANRFRQSIKQNEQYLENVQNAEGWLQATTSNLDSMLNQVMTLRERAVQSANDSLSAENRLQMASEINNIVEDLVSLANGSFLNKNLFSGTKTKIENPFLFDGNSIEYQGNTGKINRRISGNFTININVTGQDILDTNIFNSALNLRTALENDDTNEIANMIDSIDSASEKMISLNTSVGSIQNQLELAEDRLRTANLNLATFISDTEDVDLASAITQYNSEEMAYQAALQSTANILRLNILDFLK